MRLVSICPSNTELVEYLGLTASLVGVDDFSDWPEAVTTLPRLGPDLSIDMDKVEALNPDLVLASLSVPGMEKNVEELKRRGIPHIVLNPNTLEEIAQDLLTLGSVTDRAEIAKERVESYQRFIDQYRAFSNQLEKKPSLYWEWWPKPVFTPGGKNWLTEISELAGGYNLFGDIPEASVQTDWDDVKARDPDHICMAWVGVKQEKMNPSLVRRRPEWEHVNAVMNNKIHLLEESLYCRPSPRLLLGLKKLAAILHPEAYPENDDVDPLLGRKI